METKTFKYGLSSFLSLLCGNGYYDHNFFSFCFTVAAANVALNSVQIFQGGGKTIIHAQQ